MENTMTEIVEQVANSDLVTNAVEAVAENASAVVEPVKEFVKVVDKRALFRTGIIGFGIGVGVSALTLLGVSVYQKKKAAKMSQLVEAQAVEAAPAEETQEDPDVEPKK